MPKNPFDLPPGFLDAIRTAQQIKLSPDVWSIARESARLAESHLAAMKVLATAHDRLGTSAMREAIERSQLTYASQFAELHEAADRLTRSFASAAQFTAFHDSWLEQAAKTHAVIGSSVQDIMDRCSSVIGLAETSLARLEMIQVGAILGLDRRRDSIEATMKSLTDSFATIYVEDRLSLLSLPRLVVERPPQEIFVHITSVESISSAEGVDDEAETETETLWVETETALPPMLKRFSPDLVRKWQGAREALASRNPDRIAHVSVSIRELFRIVLHAVAPDDAIRKWSTSKEDFDKGRPTRRARFRYATRKIDHPPFSDFLAEDFSAALELLTLFDEGVHALRPNLTEQQVRLMTLRMGQFLWFLVEAAGEPKS